MTASPRHDHPRIAHPAPPGPIPDLSGYREIHHALRVAADQLVAVLSAQTPRKRSAPAALHRWFTGYSAELAAHHRVEDEVFFPAIAARVPAYAEYERTLTADHERLHNLIGGCNTALRRLGSAGSAGGPDEVAAALAAAVELRDLLTEHLDFENADVLPLFERHFSPAEYAALDRKAIQAVSLRQALFTVPWFMATASPQGAARTLADAPLPLKLIYRLTRGRYARLQQQAFGQLFLTSSNDRLS